MSDALPIIAGHQLHYVNGGRWGRLIHVGKTEMAFRDINDAIDYAGANPVTFAMLESEYQTFNLRHHLKLGSAEDHLFDEMLTDSERLWLVDFVRRWKSVAENEGAET
jgi:hypothetical protein